MQILIPWISLSDKASSYVAGHNKKKMNAVRGIIPQDSDVFGTIEVKWVQDESNANIYRLTWKSRLTNSITTLNKLGGSKFLVSRTSPDIDAVTFMYTNKEPAIKAFFYNTDLYRTKDANSSEARKWCASQLKRAENIKSLKFNPNRHKQAQSRLDREIFVGENKQYRAKLVGIDMSGRNVRVKLWNTATEKFDIEKTVSSDKAWIE